MTGEGFIRRRADALALVVLTLLGVALVAPQLGPHVRAAPDVLFYEAQKREVQGTDAETARAEVFNSPLAAPLIAMERDLAPADRRVDNPAWREYSAQFFRRRWTVPVLAAALDPVFGDHSIEIPSLLGWLALGPLLYLLLRLRFAPVFSLAASMICVVLPPMFEFGPAATTDVFCLSLVTAALISLFKLRDGGAGWFAAWIALAVLIAFTRDLTPVLVGTALVVALAERSRRLAAAAAAAALATVPALLAFGASLQTQLAYVLNVNRIPDDTSWGWIVDRYPGAVGHVIKSDLTYPLRHAVPVLTIALGALIVVGVVRLYATAKRRDPLLDIARAAGVFGLVTVFASPNDTFLRLELILVPTVAVALAGLAEWALEAYRRREPAPATA